MKTFKHWTWPAIASIALIILATAAIDGITRANQEKRSSGKAQVIEIEMGDYYYKPDTLHIKAGQPVQLKFKNVGILEHEFMAGKEAEKDRSGFEEDLFEGVKVEIKPEEMMGMQHEGKEAAEKQEHGEMKGHEQGMEHKEMGHGMGHGEHHGTMISVQPKQTATMSFSLPASKKGVWQMGCFLELGPKTHYDFGMKGVIVVD